MIYGMIAAILILIAANVTTSILLWKRRKNGEVLSGIASDAIVKKQEAQDQMNWYRDENLRLQGANQRLSEMIFRRKTYEQLLEMSLNTICAQCDKDKTVNPATGVPDACVKCKVYRWDDTFTALKGIHREGADENNITTDEKEGVADGTTT